MRSNVFFFSFVFLTILCSGCDDRWRDLYPPADAGSTPVDEEDSRICESYRGHIPPLGDEHGLLPTEDENLFPISAEAAQRFQTQVPESGWFAVNVEEAPTTVVLSFSEPVERMRVEHEGEELIVAGGGENTACPDIFSSTWRFDANSPGFLYFVEIVDDGAPFIVYMTTEASTAE